MTLKIKTKLDGNRDSINLRRVSREKELEIERKLREKRAMLEKEYEVDEEDREEAIEEGLSKIYTDKNGKKIDVDKLKITKKGGFVFVLFNLLVIGSIITVLGLGIYYYIFYNSGMETDAVEIEIKSKENISTNEEFFYTIYYNNSSYVALKNVSIMIDYPDDFVFLDSDFPPDSGIGLWELGRIAPKSGGEINIKGKMVATAKTAGIMMAKIIYTPENFSSEFEKETSFSNMIKSVGFEIDFNNASTVLVDEENVISIDFRALENNFIDEFVIRIEADSNFEIIDTFLNNDKGSGDDDLSLEIIQRGDEYIFDVSGVNENEQQFDIRYKINNKLTDTQKIKFYFNKENIIDGEVVESTVFFEKDVEIEVMKSDLNLILIQNGEQENASIDFEEKLNYSIAYANKGEADLNDISITVVLNSEFLDWTTLVDDNLGRERGNTITWTKDEVSELEKIEVGDSGVINFSIDVMPFSESDLGKDFDVVTYVQYSIGSIKKIGEINISTSTDDETEFDDRSNTIVSRINSDLKIKQEIRYFDEDNMPVGSGPLPPQVGEESVFKVYWILNNNLHELKDVVVTATLPDGVYWAEKNRTSVGSINYNSDENKISWEIGKLPITVFRADAEFAISIIPEEKDRNKIMVLSTGFVASALDVKTDNIIERKVGPATTKLEDDDIANISSDGLVR